MECNKTNMLSLLDKMEAELDRLQNEWHRPEAAYIKGAKTQLSYIRFVLTVVWEGKE